MGNSRFKFRAWETKEARGRMFSWDEIKGGFISYTNCKETILMQFTGLHDKNGKEIYEGDIINTVTGKPMVIGWSKRFASFTIERDGWAFKHFFGEAMESNDIEVVGNIFENPNLLNP